MRLSLIYTFNVPNSTRTFTIQTYEVQDYWYYDSLTTNKNRYTVSGGSASITYSDDGITVKGTNSQDCTVTNNVLTLPSEYIAEYTITGRSIGSYAYSTGVGLDDVFLLVHSSGNTHLFKLSTNTKFDDFDSITDGDVVTVKRTGTTMEYYVNDVLKKTLSNINSTTKQYFRTYNNRSITIKDLKIKPL